MIRKTLLYIILIFLTSCGASKKMRSSGDYASSEKVLLIGAGPVASKLFMENLSKNIAGRLNKKKIESNLLFLENSKPGSQFDKKALDSLDHDAYIILNPLDSANFVMNRTGQIPFYVGTRINAHINVLVPNSYKQKFSVQIYMKTDKTKPVWEGRLQVELDPTDEEKYNDISAYILNYLPVY